MYKYSDPNDTHISLHDCHAEKMSFIDGNLTFVFPNGFWITANHPANNSNDIVRTDSAQVDFQILDEEIDGITIYLFKKNRNSKVIREEWEAANFINAVNNGSFRIEFITQYKSFQSVLFKCWAWFDTAPYHCECEIILHSDNVTYKWNQLNYERVW